MADHRKRWLEHYPEDIPPELNYDERPLHNYLVEAGEQYPEKKALHFLGKEMTYGQLLGEVRKLASQLSDLGLRKGDRVAIMLPNCPQSVIGYYAVLMAGGIVVQTNPLYVERELLHQVTDSGAKMIICLDSVFPRVAGIQGKTELRHVIVTAIQDYLPFPKNVAYPFAQKKSKQPAVKISYGDSVHSFKALIKAASAENFEPVPVDAKNDLALLQYTGGTTGPAKGVMLTHFNLAANTTQMGRWMERTRDGKDRILSVLPFFHVYGMTVAMNFSIMFLSSMIIIPRFSSKEILKTIEKLKPTLFPGAPTMYIALINDPDIGRYDLSSIEVCVSGSAPLPLEVQRTFEKVTGGRLVEGYGLSETSPVTHFNVIFGKSKNGSIGVPCPDTDAMIISPETGEEADVHEVGELAVKGPQVMKGYWNMPEETKRVLREDGWLLTGDIGYMDEEGYFYIVDRKKDMIIASGYNIYPREVEEVLYEHPDIQEVAVLGVPDPYRGETVKAYVVAKKGKTLDKKDLDRHCRRFLAAYKVPHIYEFRDELPKTTVGKILKRTLLDEEKNKKTGDGASAVGHADGK